MHITCTLISIWLVHFQENLSPNHLDVDVIQQDVIEELSNMVDLAQEENRDETLAIFDLGSVVERFMLWEKCFPHIQPFYAVKAYDDPVVVSVLSRLGAGFDCASKNELDMVLRCGVAASNIIYANTIKFRSHLVFADHSDVTLMTVDNQEELLKIKDLVPRARLVLRMAAMPAASIELALLDKFGCSRQEALKLLKLARQLDLEVVGISFHVGSGCSDALTYIRHIKAARELFDEALSLGFKLKLLDIGGGLYGGADAKQHIKKMCGPMNATLEELFPKSSGVQVIAEPGRYFVEAGLSLATCIVGKKALCKTDGSDPDFSNNVHDTPNPENVTFEYYISEAAYGILSFQLYVKGYEFNLHPLKRQRLDTQLYTSKLWGPTCDTIDVVTECCQLPHCDIGDWLLFSDVGAYTVTIGGTFNGIPKPRIRRVIKQAVWDMLIDDEENCSSTYNGLPMNDIKDVVAG